MKDNFWEMGDTGPCGPCTEIHYDRIGGRNAAKYVNQSDPDVIEIWNNVFIQFNREADKSLRPLPAKHVDTGMGLERLVSVLQNKRSNYDTDVFAPIFAAIERITGARPYMGKLGDADKDNIDTAYRVIADHIRTLTFAITDGALPSNVGRGYVLRRILRRAVRYGRQMLNARSGFFSQLVPVVVERFGGAFPELRKDPSRVMSVIQEEEESFGRTLDRGIKLFEGVASEAEGHPDRTISGADAFKLYDTYGFPIDLTQLMASERGLSVDEAGFKSETLKAQELSRSGGKTDEKQLGLSGDDVARLKHLQVNPTDDSLKFSGHDAKARVEAIFTGSTFDEVARTSVSAAHRRIGIVVDRTPMYAEMGGQESDTGHIRLLSERRGGHRQSEGGDFVVESVRAFGGYVLHIGHVARGELHVGDTVSMEVDKMRRARTASNHTATHLANFGLRRVLGSHIDQKGSLVAPDRMRFDFSHSQPVAPEQLAEVESIVRSQIRQDLTVYAESAPLHVARNISGLRAVFGETYPDPVRVVSIGAPVRDLTDRPDNQAWNELSVEFCGGTHVSSTAIIQDFAVVSEEAVAKGVRRIVAVTGDLAVLAGSEADAFSRRIQGAAGLSDPELSRTLPGIITDLEASTMAVSRRQALRAGIASLQERLKAAEKNMAAVIRDEAVKQARVIADGASNMNDQVVVASIDMPDDKQALQAAVKVIRDRCPYASVMLFAVDAQEGKVGVSASCSEAHVKRGLKAGDWVREAAAVVGGKGGGKPDSAQGGGTEVGKVREAVSQARTNGLKIVM
jgi:alanyl-tRNA synthetase